MKELQDEKNNLHDEQMKNIQAENKIKANKTAAEVKSIKDETKILATKNTEMLDYINNPEFQKLENYISAAYLAKLKEEEKNDLINKWADMVNQTRELKKEK